MENRIYGKYLIKKRPEWQNFMSTIIEKFKSRDRILSPELAQPFQTPRSKVDVS